MPKPGMDKEQIPGMAWAAKEGFAAVRNISRGKDGETIRKDDDSTSLGCKEGTGRATKAPGDTAGGCGMVPAVETSPVSVAAVAFRPLASVIRVRVPKTG